MISFYCFIKGLNAHITTAVDRFHKNRVESDKLLYSYIYPLLTSSSIGTKAGWGWHQEKHLLQYYNVTVFYEAKRITVYLFRVRQTLLPSDVLVGTPLANLTWEFAKGAVTVPHSIHFSHIFLEITSSMTFGVVTF